MATPFKLKSGNASAFKNLGSSPAKQKPGGSVGEALEHHKAYKAKKNTPKNLNTKGSKGSTTPGYSTTKAATTKPSTAGDRLLKTAKHTAKKVLKHPVTKNVVKYGKKALKVLGKINPALSIMPAPLINPVGEKYNNQNQAL